MYAGGTSEGNNALDYFNKWGFYATLYDLADGSLINLDRLLVTDIHKLHVMLAIRNDTMKLKHTIQNQK